MNRTVSLCQFLVASLALTAIAHAETYLPESFGAVGDGITNDRAAVAQAFEAVRAAGRGRIEFNAGRTYYLGELATTDTGAIEVLNLTDAIIEGNNAQLVVNTTANALTAVIKLTGPNNVRINNLRFRDIGADWNVNWRGAAAVDLLGSAVDSGKVQLDRCSGENLLYLLSCHSAKTALIRDIVLRDCSASNTFYGINCRNNGWGLRATGCKFDNVRRAYIVYGVEDHDVELTIHHDGIAPGSSAACIVGNFGQRNTRAVRIRARFVGDTSKYLNGIDIEHQRPHDAVGGGTISGIDAAVDVQAASAMVPVRFRSYRQTNGLAVEEAVTANRITDVRLSGNLATTGNETMAFGLLTKQGVTAVTPNGVEGRLFLDASILHPQSIQPHYPSFVVGTAHGREFRTIKGNLSTQSVSIPFAALDTTPFEVIVTTWAHNSLADLALGKRTYCRDLLFCQNAGDGGAVKVSSQQNLENRNHNGAATVSYVPDGESLKVMIQGYAGNNGLARVEVEYVSRGP